MGSRSVNATVQRSSAIRTLGIGVLAWFLFVGQTLAQKASHDHAPSAEEKTPRRAVTVSDVIGMSRIRSFDDEGQAQEDSAALFSPDRSRFLILIERGDLKRNTRVFSLSLFRSETALRSPQGRLLVSFSSSSNRPAIQAVRWLDNRSIAFLGENPKEQQQLYTIDCDDKRLVKLTNHATSLSSYTINDNGQRLFYTAYQKGQPLFDPQNQRQAVVVSSQPLSDLVAGDNSYRSKVINQLFSRQLQSGNEVQIRTKGDLINQESLWLSPNGRYLIVKTSVQEIPENWDAYEDPLLRLQTRGQHRKDSLTFVYQYELIDTRSGKSDVLVNAPLARFDSELIWSPDSSAVIISRTYLPLDVSDLAQRNKRESAKFVVEVKIPSREVIPITSKDLKLIKWNSGGKRLLLQELEKPFKVLEYQKDSADWKEIEARGPDHRQPSQIEITIEENMNTPPRIFATDTKTRQKVLLADVNPQFKNIDFGEVEEVSYQASDGGQVTAGLYRPPDYVAGRRYPLVIQTHGWNPQRFWIDGPYSTAFAARALSGRGFVVLQVNEEDWTKLSTSQEISKAVGIYESGIDYLDGLGIIDKDRVGIIGFSRTGLFVEDALTHSKNHFAAATLADISDAGYFRYLALLNLSSGFASDSEGINGGVPFGDGLTSWMKNSPGFNLDKINTPVRMEANGPMSLLFEWEWFAGLTRLGRPVELIYMPFAEHVLVRPREQMISQQGNVDWFCFWLKGEEDPHPAKAEQYARWRELSRQQHRHDVTTMKSNAN